MDSITPRSWALLTWSDQQLQALADQECVGEGTSITAKQRRAACLIIYCFRFLQQSTLVTLSTVAAGPSAIVEEVESQELASLLQQREAAFVAALMALKQWEAVQQARADVQEKGDLCLSCHLRDFLQTSCMVLLPLLCSGDSNRLICCICL